MRVRGGLLLAITALVLGAGSVPTTAAPPSGPDPLIQEWPDWPYATTCEGLPFDPVSVFSGPTEAELGAGPPEVALREFLHGQENPWVKPRFWRLLARGDATAEFVRGRLAGQLERVSFALNEGRWEYRGYSSGCEPRSVVGNGPVVSWDLAVQNTPLSRSARRIRVDLDGGPCSGGRSQNARARPVFKRFRGKLLLTIWLKPLPPGIYNCRGVVEPPLTVKLPRRTRLDRILDGGTYPPSPAIELQG